MTPIYFQRKRWLPQPGEAIDLRIEKTPSLLERPKPNSENRISRQHLAQPVPVLSPAAGPCAPAAPAAPLIIAYLLSY